MSSETSNWETVISPQQLQQLLQQTFGTKVTVTGLRVGKLRHDYVVLLLDLRHPSIEVVVKLAGPQAPLACPFERTAMLHRLVASATTLPMPEVLAVDTSYQNWPWRYFIRTQVPGHEWAVVRQQMSYAERSKALGQIGDAVAQLHSIAFPAFGEIAADGGVQGEGSYLAALSTHARAIIKHAQSREMFLEALEQKQGLFSDVGEASLCHEDLHKHNILFRYRQGRWHLAAILDFDKAWAGHHETDLARLEFWRGMTSPEFWEAYEAIHPVDALYKQRRALYQFLWCLEYAQPTTTHLADTERLCTILEVPRLERFE